MGDMEIRRGSMKVGEGMRGVVREVGGIGGEREEVGRMWGSSVEKEIVD
jgi:hypothetical protein